MARGGGNCRGGRGRASVQSCSSIGRGVIRVENVSRDTHLVAESGDQIPLTTDEHTESSQQPNKRASAMNETLAYRSHRQIIVPYGNIIRILMMLSKLFLRYRLNSFTLGLGVASLHCSRQAARIRNLYLKTIFRQDVSFFDKETNTGEVIGRMSGDTVLIQDAMGEKVGEFTQLFSTFIGGFVLHLPRDGF